MVVKNANDGSSRYGNGILGTSSKTIYNVRGLLLLLTSEKVWLTLLHRG